MTVFRRQEVARALLAALAQLGDSKPPTRRIVEQRRARRDLLRAGVDPSHAPEPLDLAFLRHALAGRATLALRWGCPSTMDGLAVDRRPTPHFLLSEWQWAGRGRHRRRWQSPLSGNYYIGLALDLHANPALLPTLPLLLGVAVAEQVRAVGIAAQLKWPNDIVVGGRKLGGVLVELQQRPGGLRAHIGLGLNWRLPDAARRAVDREVTDLHSLCTTLPGRNQLLAALLLALLDAVAALHNGSTAQWLARWRALDSLHGNTLRVLQAGVAIEGVADSVDARGRLRLLTSSGLQLLDAGEVLQVRVPTAASVACGLDSLTN